MRRIGLRQLEHGLLRSGQGEASEAQARRHLFHPRAVPFPEPRPDGHALPLDPKLLGPAMQPDHPPGLAGTLIEEEAPPAHPRRKPRPSSSMRVS